MSIKVSRVARHYTQLLPVPAIIDGYGEYPGKLRVSFANGRTKVYELAVKQPEPTFFSELEMKRMNKTPGSYRFEERRVESWKLKRNYRKR